MKDVKLFQAESLREYLSRGIPKWQETSWENMQPVSFTAF